MEVVELGDRDVDDESDEKEDTRNTPAHRVGKSKDAVERTE